MINTKNIMINLFVIAIMVCIFTVPVSAFEHEKAEQPQTVIVQEDPNKIQTIDTTNYEVEAFIENIQDSEKRAIISEINNTPVEEDIKTCNEIDLISKSDYYTNGLKMVAEMEKLPVDDLKKILDETKTKNVELKSKEKSLDNELEDLMDGLANITTDKSSSSSVKTYSETMEKSKKTITGKLLYGLKCKVTWKVYNGKITYLAPYTTKLCSSDYTYYGSLISSQELTSNDTKGIVFKQQHFGLKKDGHSSATVTMAGNYYTDGTWKWHGDIK